MSFSEKISQLQSIYRTQHDLSNKIGGALFAEEKGALSDEEKKELDEMKLQSEQLGKEENSLREKIKSEFPEDYVQHLSSLHSKLVLIQKHLIAMQGELEFKHSFNKTICESLLSDLTKLIQRKKHKYDLSWLFDVSDSLVKQYQETLKF